MHLLLRRIQGGGRGHQVDVSRPARGAERPAAHRPGLGGWQPLPGCAGRADTGAAEVAVADHQGNEGRARWCSWPLTWRTAAGWTGPSAGQACGAAGATPTACGPATPFDLLASRGDRTRPPAAAARRDGSSRPGLAGIVTLRTSRARPLPAARHLPSPRPARPPVLVHTAPLAAATSSPPWRATSPAAAQQH